MTIKKVPTGYETRFRVAGRGTRTYKRIFPTKGECDRFERHTIAQYETHSDSISSFIRALKHTAIDVTFKKAKGQAAHVLRHTFASHFMMNGGNILTLQKVLGHSDIKMTMRYSHLSPDFLEEATRLNPLSDTARK